MSNEMNNAVQHEVVKWGVVVVLALVTTGVLSLANRNVYSKEQVDALIDYQANTRNLQLQVLTVQLTRIEQDVKEIKAGVVK